MTTLNPQDEYFSWPVYGLPAQQKTEQLAHALSALTRHHRDNCPEYGRILKAHGYSADSVQRLEDLPFIPVRLFKEYALKSIPDADVFKTLTSSGTTSQQVSRIFLDRQTASAQSKALVKILQQFLGKARLPMLILDHPGVVKNRLSFSARGAGILGMSSFGRDHTYALTDDDMQPDLTAIRDFLARHEGERLLLFGFTFMVWKYIYQALRELDDPPAFNQAVLIHSGGWKKLHDEAVDNETFKAKLRDTLHIETVHNFYGMVEQVGSIFMECEHGRLHAPAFADVLVRDARDWSLKPRGETGLLQVLSVLPHSYPGHSLLTEDIGHWIGLDDCPCGRLGRTFHVQGRVARAEVRGCSDTHAADVSSRSPEAAHGS